MVAVNRDRVCMARTTEVMVVDTFAKISGERPTPYYCTLPPHDPMDDHEAVTASGPLTWWDPTEGETDE